MEQIQKNTQENNITKNPTLEGLIYEENFIDNSEELFEYLEKNADWNTSMKARHTASFGIPYDYRQMEYKEIPIPDILQKIIDKITTKFNFTPTNCLVNHYLDGKSRMGYHSDRIDNLQKDTGIVIVSIGEKRLLKFRKIIDNNNNTNNNNNQQKNSEKQEFTDFYLESGSVVYMSQQLQKTHQHSVPQGGNHNARMSLTFRHVVPTEDNESEQQKIY